MENIFVEFLPPWVETGLQPAFYDKESGTVLQQTARMYDRVNMLIRMFNKLSKNTKETVENYISQFDNLYEYVHDYFDNLDVQEEIDNKLDEMLDDGTLADIIAGYIQLRGILAYQTVSELKSASNLANGSYAETYGYYTAGDGGSAKYKIRTIQGGETADDRKLIAITGTTLVAELMDKDTVSVRQIGAYGDGTHDDTNVFKYAVENFKKTTVPFGEYLITDTIFIPDNTIIEGENNNSFLNGYEKGATILYNSNNEGDPVFSFLGKDNNGVNHKDVYKIAGSQLDNGTYTQTLNSKLLKLNIRTENNHNVAVVFAGCPNSELQVSCYGFKVGIITSACWGSDIHNCFALCNYGIMCLSDNNGVSVKDSYFDCSDNTISIANDNTLYSIVTDGSFYSAQQNKASGMLTYFVNNLILENVICEHFVIGYNFGSSSRITGLGVYGEGNTNWMMTYTGDIDLNGIYAFTGTSNLTAIKYNLTKLSIKNMYCTYTKLLEEVNSPTNRYGNFYILENIGGTNVIDFFDSAKPDVLYYDASASTKEGILGSPASNFDNLVSMIKDGGTIILKSNLTIAGSGSYKTIGKSITIKSDDTTRTVSNDTTKANVYPTRFLRDLTFEDVTINVSTTASPSDVSLSSLLNPYTALPKKLTLRNCTLTTTSFNGLLNADWNRNTLCDVILDTVSITGGCILTTNHSSGSSKKININLYKSGVTSEDTLVKGSQTVTVYELEN